VIDDVTPGVIPLPDGRAIGIADRFTSAVAPINYGVTVRYCWDCLVAMPGPWCFVCELPTTPEPPPTWDAEKQDFGAASEMARELAGAYPTPHWTDLNEVN